MSRCFPFPPPGYEKKTRTGELDLLLKEKQREKKHKKEKEKKERKENREKDGSKEKHRDKDRKERHKDRKREKDREKDKHKARDDEKIKGRTTNDTTGKGVEKHQVADEKRFADEFIRRIRDDGRNAGDQMVEKFNGGDHRQIEVSDKAKKIEVKEKNKEIQIEGLDTARIIGVKDKNKDKRTEGIDMPRESLDIKEKNKQQGTLGIERPNKDVGKNKIKEKQVEGIYRPKEDGMDKDKNRERRVQGIERPKEEVVGNHSNREWQVHGIGRPKEDILGKDKNKEWWVEGIDGPKDAKTKEKKKGKEGDSKNKERHKDGGQQRDEKKGKSKAKSREKEKEKEKVKEVLVGKLTEKEGIVNTLIEQKPGESGNKLLSGTVSVAAAGHTKNAAKIAGVSTTGHAKDTSKTASVDPNVRKRKEMEINGVLHDGIRPHKLLRPNFGTALPLENGYKVETVHIGVHQALDRQGGLDNRKPESIAYSNSCALSPLRKEHKINGKIEPQLLTVSLKPSASATVVATGTGTSESSKPPHPDSKYLNQILTVPKMPEWSEFDDQEWLFSSSDAQSKRSFQSEIDGMPQVWSEALHIETADMHALPYVIPY
ncbi:uncharacterized protein LOC116250217 [Nymphaea colorata]|nr:uncharacterized protein LOC116250217 [Nymphaea colorata]